MISNKYLFQIIRRDDFSTFLKYIDEIELNTLNEYGQNMLHEAIAFKKNGIANKLIDLGINLNQQDYRGQTPLHFISINSEIELVKKMLANGANVDIKDKYGNIPLWYAVFYVKGKYEIVELLMQYHSDPFTKNNVNRSPLDFAEIKSNPKLIEILKQIY